MKVVNWIFISIIVVTASEKWVLGDWLNVRNAPKRHASIVAQIPAGTHCFTGDKKGDWIHVDSVALSQGDYRTLLGSVSGWVKSSLLTDSLYENFFINHISKATSVDSVEMWIKRDIAAGNKESSKLLFEHYTLNDDSVGILEWKALYKRDEFQPIYLVVPHFNQMRVIGYIDEKGTFHSLEWSFTFEQPEKGSALLRNDWDYAETEDRNNRAHAMKSIPDILRSVWYTGGNTYGDMTEAISYTVSEFPPAKIDRRIVEQGNEFYYYEIGDAGRAGLSLGKLEGKYYQKLLATTPFKRVLSEGRKKLDTEKLLQTAYSVVTDCYAEIKSPEIIYKPWFERINSYKITHLPYGFTDVALEGSLVPPNDVRSFEILFDSAGNKVWPGDSTGWGNVPENRDGSFYGARFETGWISFESLPGMYYSIIPFTSPSEYWYDSSESGGSGLLLRILTKDGITTQTLFYDGWGC